MHLFYKLISMNNHPNANFAKKRHRRTKDDKVTLDSSRLFEITNATVANSILASPLFTLIKNKNIIKYQYTS